MKSEGAHPGGLYGAFLPEGKNQTAFEAKTDDTTLGYTKRVMKETNNYSAEVGLRQVLWGFRQARAVFLAGWIFRNASQLTIKKDSQGKESLDIDGTYSDRSVSSRKLALRIATEDGNDFDGSFVEFGRIHDSFYSAASARVVLRGRLSSRLSFLDMKRPSFFFEGYINRSLGKRPVQEKDESVILVGLRISLDPTANNRESQ
jgi:hypothetical protein